MFDGENTDSSARVAVSAALVAAHLCALMLGCGGSGKKQVMSVPAGESGAAGASDNAGSGEGGTSGDGGGAGASGTPTAIPPTIAKQPMDLTVRVGSPATFSVVLGAGSEPVSYQWARDGVVIEGATRSSYTVPVTVIGDDSASFVVEIASSAGKTSSTPATLTVTAAPATSSGTCFGTGKSGGWCWQSRSPVSVTLYGGAAANADVAWAIGELGVVIKTIDGGTTWQRVRPWDAEGGFFKSLSAADTNNVWAVGTGGRIIKTSDGGLTWTSQNSGSTDLLNDVVASSAKVAWSVGFNGVLRTIDGGNTWQKSTTLAEPLYRLAAPSASVAYVTIQPDSVAKTTDGGVTWSKSQLLGLEGSLATAISAPSASVAWVVGKTDLVERTTDGKNWVNTTRPLQSSASPLSILASSDLTAYISYEDGSIVRTIDGGASWSQVASNRFGPTQALFAADASTLWGVGAVGTIVQSKNAGLTWTEQSRGPQLQLTSVAAVDPNTAWVAGFGCVIARTTDAGATWPLVHDESESLTPFADANCEVSSVSTSKAWAAGGFGERLIKTSDGGATWQPGSDLTGVRTVTVVDPNTVWIAGRDGLIAKTVNAGATWTVQNSGTMRGVFKVYALDAQVAYAAFDDGSVRRTGDGGASWALATGFNNQHTSIVPLDAKRVVSVELKGVIRRSLDGGATFMPVASGTIEDLNSATRAGGDTLFAAGMFVILRSDDAGLTWRSQPIPKFEVGVLEAIGAVDSNRVWAVSFNSGILHTADGGD